MATESGGCRSAAYSRRHPEQTVLYHVVQHDLETYLMLAREGDWDGHAVPTYVERDFRRYLECGILAYGFARAYCADCGRDFLVAFSCKGRTVCPSCNARRMAETAAHLVDHVFPPLPVRQWVLSLPKRLRRHNDGGFSLDAAVQIPAWDRAGLERLLRYCARPPFALDRLEAVDDAHRRYHLSKPQPDGTTELSFTPLELIDRIAALVPPPRVHRHRYYGVLAPNSPLRAQVTALAQETTEETASTTEADDTDGPDSLARSPARYLWATLIARLFEIFPLTCPYRITDYVWCSSSSNHAADHVSPASASRTVI